MIAYLIKFLKCYRNSAFIYKKLKPVCKIHLVAFFLFFIFNASAQSSRYTENYYKSIVSIEGVITSLIDSSYVLLVEDDEHVKHQFTFSSTKDSLVYKADFFERTETYKAFFKIGLADIILIALEENEYINSRFQITISTQNNKILHYKNYLNEPPTVGYVNSFNVPINRGLSEQELYDLQHDFLYLKNELLPYQPEADSAKIKSARVHVKEAVLQRLIAMQPLPDALETLIKNIKVFVAKCQICMGVQDAIKAYLRTADPKNGISILFDSEVNEILYARLQEFVAESVSNYLVYPNFNDSEIEIIHALIAKERMNSIRNFKVNACAACDGAVGTKIEDILTIDATIQKLQMILNQVNYNTSFENRKNLTAISQQRFSLGEVSYIENIRVEGKSNFYERKYFQIPWHAMTDTIVIEHHEHYLSKIKIQFSEGLSFIEDYQAFRDQEKSDLFNTNALQLFVWKEDAETVKQTLMTLSKQVKRDKEATD